MTIGNNYISAFVAVTIGLTAVSCSDRTDNVFDRGEISFTAQVGEASTKMMNNTWEDGDQIRVKAVNVEKTYSASAGGALSVVDDTPFQWEGAAFDIEAWYPYTAEAIVLTDQTTEEKFYACDLLYSKATAESKQVSLTFSHKMTRVWWGFQNQDNSGYTAEEVAAAKITLYGYASATYSEGVVTPVGDPDQEISTWDKEEGFRVGEAILVPCEMWDKPLIKVKIGGDTYVYTPTKAEDAEGKNPGVLKENTLQKYYLQISKEDFTVTMTSSIGEWENGDMGAIYPDLQ